MKSATKKTAKRGKATAAKPKAKAGAKQSDGRDQKGRFVKGNSEQEVWTEAKVLPILQAMWKTVAFQSDGTEPEDRNYVRANDIKYQGELCLMHDIDKDTWTHWKWKFCTNPNGRRKKAAADEETTEIEVEQPGEKAPEVSPAGRLIKKICELLEMRLLYSGATMDIFALKAHYGYRDQQNVDMTTKGKEFEGVNPFLQFLKSTGTLKKEGK